MPTYTCLLFCIIAKDITAIVLASCPAPRRHRSYTDNTIAGNPRCPVITNIRLFNFWPLFWFMRLSNWNLRVGQFVVRPRWKLSRHARVSVCYTLFVMVHYEQSPLTVRRITGRKRRILYYICQRRSMNYLQITISKYLIHSTIKVLRKLQLSSSITR